MELLEYIKKNYKTPNVAVLRTLGASEELIEYLTNTPNNTNIKVVESLINEGGSDENKQGLKSITISPAITTTPALDSLFPIYWDDLTEEQKQNSITYSLTSSNEPAVGEPITVTVTPTPDWYVFGNEAAGEKGQPLSFTVNYEQGMFNENPFVVVNELPTDGMPEKHVIVYLAITFSQPQD